jgi:plastocyanin
MKGQRIILGSALLVLAGCQTIGGESMPTLTRTGEVKDVIIRDGVEPTSVNANPGDEIRWINKRQGAIRIIFLNPMTENLNCQRNFGGPMGFGTKRNEYAAKLGSNETASVCFRDPGEVKYVVRAATNDPIGEQNIAGSILIGGRDMARESTVGRDAARDTARESTVDRGPRSSDSASRVEEEPASSR